MAADSPSSPVQRLADLTMAVMRRHRLRTPRDAGLLVRDDVVRLIGDVFEMPSARDWLVPVAGAAAVEAARKAVSSPPPSVTPLSLRSGSATAPTSAAAAAAASVPVSHVPIIAAHRVRCGELIDKGSSKWVYRATWDGVPCALLQMQSLKTDSTTLQKFDHEVRVLGRLRHPNIVSVFGRVENELWFLAELCDQSLLKALSGKSRAQPSAQVQAQAHATANAADVKATTPQHVAASAAGAGAGAPSTAVTAALGLQKQHPLTEEQRWLFARDAARAVAYLHAQSPPIIHCDISPGNLLVTAGDTLKLTDFGLSRVQPNPSGADVRTVSGTLPYMAPEQVELMVAAARKNAIRGMPAATDAATAAAAARVARTYQRLSTAVDVYALGVVLVHLFTGVRPWSTATADADEARSPLPPELDALPDDDRYAALKRDVLVPCLQLDAHKRPTAQRVLDTLARVGPSYLIVDAEAAGAERDDARQRVLRLTARVASLTATVHALAERELQRDPPSAWSTHVVAYWLQRELEPNKLPIVLDEWLSRYERNAPDALDGPKLLALTIKSVAAIDRHADVYELASFLESIATLQTRDREMRATSPLALLAVADSQYRAHTAQLEADCARERDALRAEITRLKQALAECGTRTGAAGVAAGSATTIGTVTAQQLYTHTTSNTTIATPRAIVVVSGAGAVASSTGAAVTNFGLNVATTNTAPITAAAAAVAAAAPPASPPTVSSPSTTHAGSSAL